MVYMFYVHVLNVFPVMILSKGVMYVLGWVTDTYTSTGAFWRE